MSRARGLLAALLGPRCDRPEAMATPFAAAALAASVAMPLWSYAGGDPSSSALTWALALSALVYASFAAAYRGPVWLIPALALGDLVYVRVLSDAGVVDSPSSTALSLVAPAVAAVLAGEALWAREGRPRLFRGLPLPWAQPLLVHGALLLLGSLAVASIEVATGLVAAAAYAALLAVVAQHRRSRDLAWSSLALVALAAAQAERWAGTPATQIAPHVALAALGARLAADAIAGLARRRAAAAISGVWTRPLRAASAIATAGALGGALAVWALGDLVSENLQLLSTTVAVVGLTAIATAYSTRWLLLSYLGIALLVGAYMLQLLRFEVDQPLLFAIPAGLYLLGVSFFERRQGRLLAVPALQWGGLLLVLGAPLLLATGLASSDFSAEWNRRVLFGLSLGAISGAVLVQWRRPFLAGIIAFLANLILLLTEPNDNVLQWIAFGLTGLLMMALGLWAEQQRPMLSSWWQRIERWD